MSERLIARVLTFSSVTVPTLIEGITVRKIPEGAPAGNGAVAFKPAASAYLESSTESTFPVSRPIFRAGPVPIRASTHGMPSQSTSGTSAANFRFLEFTPDCAKVLLPAQRIAAARKEVIRKLYRMFMEGFLLSWRTRSPNYGRRQRHDVSIRNAVLPVGPWRSWERASMASRRSWVRIPSAPPNTKWSGPET